VKIPCGQAVAIPAENFYLDKKTAGSGIIYFVTGLAELLLNRNGRISCSD